ncbi:MULE domain-containing protein [Aphis craccivora]|uniref:MULE domain-containing protein n=1 Tax=Aphis craccivora TaxID=307492 RepID=A0A6G0YER2_APHCR|nr:MULE domain-containing protein [Aphis craccivora]
MEFVNSEKSKPIILYEGYKFRFHKTLNDDVRKAIEDISCKPSTLIRSELKKGDVSTLTTNDLSLIRHNVHCVRLSVHPPLPKCIKKLHAALESMNIKTNIDGTFKSCPKRFYELFTIYGLKNDVYLPLVFFLLPDKCNKCAFQHLTRHSMSIGLTCSPTDVVIDFEQAIHNAVAEVFPNAKIRGCRFHLLQSWWRKIQS